MTELEKATANSPSPNGIRVPSPWICVTFGCWIHSLSIGVRSSAVIGLTALKRSSAAPSPAPTSRIRSSGARRQRRAKRSYRPRRHPSTVGLVDAQWRSR